MISKQTIEKVCEAADIYEVVKDAGIALKRSGTIYKGLCPFHQEKTPSFVVNPIRNRWHCFGGCSSHDNDGDSISFLMKRNNITFVETVRLLGAKYNIDVEDEEETETDKQLRLKHEALLSINKRVAEFYATLLPGNGKAMKYAEKRFDVHYITETNLGYAPPRNLLLSWAKKTNENIDLFIELGLITQVVDEKTGTERMYDTFRDRLMFPIVSLTHQIVGFTGRDLSNKEEVPKYLNSKNSDVFQKSDVIYGINTATNEARKQGFFYLVEGSADADKMKSIGIYNVVASLGGVWSDRQLLILKRISPSVCFINDADIKKEGAKFCAGIQFVMDNGKKAIEIGLNVSVRELMPKKHRKDGKEVMEKVDPADFFTSIDKLNDERHLKRREDFPLWYANKVYDKNGTAQDKTLIMRDFAILLSHIRDSVTRQVYFDEINSKLIRKKALFEKILEDEVRNRKNDRESERIKTMDLESFGFHIVNSGYVSGGNTWSNFTMEPLYHIKDSESPLRLFRIKNNRNSEDLLSLNTEELISVSAFQRKIEGLGNYIWEGKSADYVRLRKFLYQNTQSAILIKEIGWKKDIGFVFGNAIWDEDGQSVVYADKNGIVNLGKRGNWFLPAASTIDENEDPQYERQRHVSFNKLSNITLKDYLHDFCEVFGNNGMVGIAFWISTLWRDIIVETTRAFPLLNLFGSTGTGKTEMGKALMTFFGAITQVPNFRNTTGAALNGEVGLYSNALYYIDEYKNSLDVKIIEILKSFYDGSGRTKMGGANYTYSTMTKVRCGFIFSGQEMPTADIALLKRCVFLEFLHSDYSQEERDRLTALFEKNRLGLTYLNEDVFRQRDHFKLNYPRIYTEVQAEIQSAISKQEGKMESRVLECWARICATVKCIEHRLPLPFTYEEFLSFSITMMLRQNKLCKSSDEKAVFWRNIEYLATDGKIFKNADFKIRTISDLELTDGRTISTAFPVSYLFVNKKRIMQLFNQCVLRQGEKTIPVDTLTHYLENSPQYVGNVKAVAFDCIVNGQLQYVTEPRTGKTKKKRNTLSAMVFDYGALKTAYELDLEGFDRTDQDTIAFEQSNTESTENTSTSSSAQNNDSETEPQQPDDDDYP